MSDNPCVKPSFDPLPTDPLFEDCVIAPVPPPITDCPDVDVPTPDAATEVDQGGRGSTVLPIVVQACSDCNLTVQYVVVGPGGSFFPVGSPFSATAGSPSCQCQNIWPGMVGWATQDRQSGTWTANIAGVSPQIAFRLTANMSGGSAAAKIYVANGGSYVDSGRTTTVYDPLNSFPCAKSGASGYAFCRPCNDGVSTRWEITYVQQMAPKIKFQLPTKLNEGDTEKNVTVVEAYGTGYYKPEAGDTVTVMSTLRWRGQANAYGLASLNSNCKYVIDNIDCPDEDPEEE